MHFARGGWFSSLTVHVRRDGIWSPVSSLTVAPAYPGVHDGESYETYTLTFAPTTGDAIRIWGRPGGKDDFVSVGELRVYGEGPASEPAPPPAPTATPVPDPTRTATPARAATPTEPAVPPTATAVAEPTAQPTTAAEPTIAATPAAAICGDGRRDGAEACDGDDAAACPGLCRADCTCADRYTFPLDGWVPRKKQPGRAHLAASADGARARVLVVEGGRDEGVAYPERPTLALPFPILSFTTRSEAGARLQVAVRGADGRSYVLSYDADDGVPLARKRQSRFPIGVRPQRFRTTLRDLEADLRAAFDVGFGAVTQVTILGTMRVSDVTVAGRGVLGDEPAPAPEIVLPAAGWAQRGLGTVVENEYDAELAAPTLRTEPRDAERARIAVSFPKRETLAAAYRTFSMVVRDERRLAVEVRVRVRHGVARLRYDMAVSAPVVKGRKTTLPLPATPIEGSAYRLVTIDLAEDLARVVPGATLDGVLGVRVQGKFRIGDVVLREPME
jgi:hypothetical protein